MTKTTNKFKQIRENAKPSHRKQEVFAKEILDCSTGTISEIETGKIRPSNKFMKNYIVYRQEQLYPRIINLNYYLDVDFSIPFYPKNEKIKIKDKTFTIDQLINERYIRQVKQANQKIPSILESNCQSNYYQLSRQCETLDELIEEVYGLTSKSQTVLQSITSGTIHKDRLLKLNPYTLSSFNKVIEAPNFLDFIYSIDNTLYELLEKDNNSLPTKETFDNHISKLNKIFNDFIKKSLIEEIYNKYSSSGVNQREIEEYYM